MSTELLAGLLGLHSLAGFWQATPLSWYSGIVDGITYALTYIPRAIETAALSALLYALKPLVLTTPSVMDRGLFFNLSTSQSLVYSPFLASSTPFTDSNGNQYAMGIIPAFYNKAARLTSMVLVLGFVVSSFMITTGIFNANWRTTAVSNLKKALVFGALSFFSIYIFQAIIELNASLVSYFYKASEYDADLARLLTSLFQAPGDASAQLASLFGMGVALIALLFVVLELVARLGIVVFLPALAPLIMLMMSFSFTEKAAKKMFEFFVGAVLLQLGVVICLKFTMQILIAVGQTQALGNIPAWAVLSGCSILMAYLPKLIIPGTQAVSQGVSTLKQGVAATAAVTAIGAGVTAYAAGGASKMLAGASQGTALGGSLQQIARGGEWLARHGSAPLRAGSSHLGRATGDAVGVAEVAQGVATRHRATADGQREAQQDLARQAGRPADSVAPGNILVKDEAGSIKEVPAYTQGASYRAGAKLPEALQHATTGHRSAQNSKEAQLTGSADALLAASDLSLEAQEKTLARAAAGPGGDAAEPSLRIVRRLRLSTEIQPQLDAMQTAPSPQGVVDAYNGAVASIQALQAPPERKQELQQSAADQLARVSAARGIEYTTNAQGSAALTSLAGTGPVPGAVGERLLGIHARALQASRPGVLERDGSAAARKVEVEAAYADVVAHSVREAVAGTNEKASALQAIERMPLKSRAAQAGVGREASKWRALDNFILNSRTLPETLTEKGLDAVSKNNVVRIEESIRLEVSRPEAQRPLLEALEAVRRAPAPLPAAQTVALQVPILVVTNASAAGIDEDSPALALKRRLGEGKPKP